MTLEAMIIVYNSERSCNWYCQNIYIIKLWWRS